MSVSEKVGQGEWEAARFRGKYEETAYSRFLCRVVVGDETLTGIINVRKREKRGSGILSIPMEAVPGFPLAAYVDTNRSLFTDPDNNQAIAEELGLVFRRTYRDLMVSYLGGGQDILGVKNNLIVSNEFSPLAPDVSEPGDIGVAMGLAQHIMDSLPGGWQITPEPVMSR